MLARKALAIKRRIYGDDHPILTPIIFTLSNTLQDDKKNNNERKELLEKSLAISIKREGSDCNNTAVMHYYLAMFYHEITTKQNTQFGVEKVHKSMEQLRIAESHAKEAVRIRTKLNGASHITTLEQIQLLSKINLSIDILKATIATNS